jgi:hypothetical protein
MCGFALNPNPLPHHQIHISHPSKGARLNITGIGAKTPSNLKRGQGRDLSTCVCPFRNTKNDANILSRKQFFQATSELSSSSKQVMGVYISKWLKRSGAGSGARSGMQSGAQSRARSGTNELSQTIASRRLDLPSSKVIHG